jgi:hypothetical protein
MSDGSNSEGLVKKYLPGVIVATIIGGASVLIAGVPMAEFAVAAIRGSTPMADSMILNGKVAAECLAMPACVDLVRMETIARVSMYLLSAGIGNGMCGLTRLAIDNKTGRMSGFWRPPQ